MDLSDASQRHNVNDGFYELAYKEDGVYLTVHPPVGNGLKVNLNDVQNKLTRKRITSFNKETAAQAVQKAERIPVKIAEPQEETKIDAAITITTSPDKMKAFINITPPEGGKMFSKEEVLILLASNSVTFGINMTLLDSLSKYPVFNEKICIAEGQPAVNGENGSVEYHFDINRDRKPVILEDGRVDYRELNLIESVNKGQKLCTRKPPTQGVKGKTVTGTDIPAVDGKPAPIPRGRNVEISEDGLTLIAGIDGQVNLIDGKVSVFALYEVSADVDNSTGNINFIGNVVIRGNVLSGFIVEAGGNVEVWGVVEGAVIKAGGNIILKRGIQGLGKGHLLSGGDIVAKYIEHSTVEAKNDIKAEAVMHSTIKCGNKLELGGRKGLLVGGCSKVSKEISAKVIGSHMAIATDLEVGVDPNLREAYKASREELSMLEADIVKADQAIKILKKLETARSLTPERQEMLAKSIRTKIYFTNRIHELKESINEMEERLQLENYGKIRIYNYIYPGTKVTIGTCMMYIKDTLEYCILYRDGADIKIGPMDRY